MGASVLRARAANIVKKITFSLWVDFYLKICYSYIVRKEINTIIRKEKTNDKNRTIRTNKGSN